VFGRDGKVKTQEGLKYVGQSTEQKSIVTCSGAGRGAGRIKDCGGTGPRVAKLLQRKAGAAMAREG